MCGSDRCESFTLISLENCRRMPPAFLPVDPEPSRSRSRTRMSRTPFFVRWYAMEAPMIPPPTMTTSAVRRIVAMVRSPEDSGYGAEGGNRTPKPLRAAAPEAAVFTVSPLRRDHEFYQLLSE